MFSFLKITPDTAVALTAGKAPSSIEKQEFAAHIEKRGFTNPTCHPRWRAGDAP